MMQSRIFRGLLQPLAAVATLATLVATYETLREVKIHDTQSWHWAKLLCVHACHLGPYLKLHSKHICTGAELTSPYLSQSHCWYKDTNCGCTSCLAAISLQNVEWRWFLQMGSILPANAPSLSAAANAPLGFTSFALSLLLVFRTNTSYARWAEAREIWGGITNRSRDILRQVRPTGLHADCDFSRRFMSHGGVAARLHLMQQLLPG